MKEKSAEKKPGIWKSFFHMLISAKLPWLWVIITFALSIGSSALQLLFPDYTEQIMGGDLAKNTILIFVAVMIGSMIVNILANALQNIASAKITRQMRRSVWEILTGLSIPEIEEKGSKELISRTTTDTASVGQIFASTLPGIVSTVYYVVGSVVKVGDYDSRLSVTMLLLIVLQLGVSFFAGRVVFRLNSQVQAKLAHLTEMISEVMSNLPLVKIFTAEERESSRGKQKIYDYYMSSFQAQNISNLFYYTASLVNLLGRLVVIVYGGMLVKEGAIDIGAWVAYFMYYHYLTYDIQMVPYYWKELKGIQGTVSRLSAVSELKPENLETGKSLVPEKQTISFEHVKFSYGEKNVLEDVSFEVPYGSTVALVGKNGAGKTTLLNLLERFYQPESGKICYGGENAEDYSLASWRKLFGYVQQDVRLMGGTIRENLTYGMEREPSEEEIRAVCQKVKLDDFLSEAPQGLDTPVDDFGDNLSGGQRQKIAIARALLRDAECLLLDEYTSSLDGVSTEQAAQCIETLHGEKTVFVIAHNLSTVKNADRIIVLADGKIQASGTHEELEKTSSVYRNLLQAQMNEQEGK